MNEQLFLVLTYLLVYGAVGLVPLYWAHIAKSNCERLFSGLFLIYYASFMLTMFAISTGAIAGMSEEQISSLAKLDDFKQYVILLGFIYTFLFGGVGTNIVTSSISVNSDERVLKAVERLEVKVDTLLKKAPTPRSNNHKVVIGLCFSIFLFSIVMISIWL
ncbi:hypothetical protein QTO12_25935 [Vibrio owensii]|uniref:hypothetical protein n=1 Tax=Vibrio owensii TaxID=696485 RepID=UPI002A661BAB|nr:hypothetical protein [Vibrio harveyi]EKO3855099.1 hypothetical protein [Vibrio harveyi]MDF4372244.1 hypothetical protein [Vibrio parahaemolyticus]MDG2609182.1 hypothetical protein [Vibrio parahaemolyticus]